VTGADPPYDVPLRPAASRHVGVVRPESNPYRFLPHLSSRRVVPPPCAIRWVALIATLSSAMSHLEQLLAEYHEWLGRVVKCNVKVGKRARGGYEMELDIVAYDPQATRIIHVEPSLDALSWAKREARYAKKFEAGRKYILPELFPWLPAETPIEQRAVLISAADNRRTLAGAQVCSVDELIAEIKSAVSCKGVASRAAISEHYPLLRTIQLVVCGYYRLVGATATR
jgi:hypothetical protein